jgi:hypothetical protein
MVREGQSVRDEVNFLPSFGGNRTMLSVLLPKVWVDADILIYTNIHFIIKFYWGCYGTKMKLSEWGTSNHKSSVVNYKAQ